MPLFITTPPAAAPVRLTTEWRSLVDGGCRIKLLDDDQDGPGAAAIIENLGDAGEQNPGPASFRQGGRLLTLAAFVSSFLICSNSR